jgi:hypothetical protein
VFKHADGARLVVLDVTFALPKAWTPNLRYAELAKAVEAGVAGPTPRQVSDAVIAIRRRKLPDPAEIGNAGSFFKNPVVAGEHCARVLARWPDLVHHVQPDGSEKLAAGWLIDQCGWKGKPGPRRRLSEAGAGAGEQWRRQRRGSAGAGARDPGGCAGPLWGAAGAGTGDAVLTYCLRRCALPCGLCCTLLRCHRAA